MQLNYESLLSPNAEPAPKPAATASNSGVTMGLGLEAVVNRLAVHRAQLTAIAEDFTQRQRAAQATAARRQAEAIEQRAALIARATQISDLEAEIAAGMHAARQLHEARLTQLALSVGHLRQRIRERLELQLARISSAEDGAQAAAIRRNLAAVTDCEQRRSAFLKTVAEQRARLATIEAVLNRVAQRARGPQVPARPRPLDPTGGAEARLAQFVVDLDGLSEQIESAAQSGIANDCGAFGQILNHGVVLLGLVGIAFGLPYLHIEVALPWIAAVAIVSQIGVALFTVHRRKQLGLLVNPSRPALHQLGESLTRLELAGRSELDPHGPLQQRLDRTLALDAEHTAGESAARSAAERAAHALKLKEQRIRDRLDRRLAGAEGRLRQEILSARAVSQVRQQAALAESDAAQAEAERLAQAVWDNEREQCVVAWQAGLAALQTALASDCAALAAAHPPWTAASWATWTPGLDFPGEIPLGTSERLLRDFVAGIAGQALPVPATAILRVPVALGFPLPAAMFVATRADGRAAALDLITHTLLRALTGFPPGRVRLTVIDPVGLGDAFAPFLALSEHGEAVLARGVLNEASAIEQGLGDLVAHLEVVIQKRLRGRYATIEEYNREAGELQEALHYVAIADFPTGFGERALERLAVLARSGARCGVHLVIHHDERKPLPATFDLAWLRRAGVMVREKEGVLALERDGLADWTFHPEPPPNSELFQRVIGIVGAAGENAKRVEVPFHAVAPSLAERWSRSSAKDLRIPLGKRGADRLQDLELGRGTAQHVLVGGRTGSGKSTLFHVLITSAALWYPPSELEFHLIDFKKGVEFKAYANLKLPHARVIAIESDREFGLSVLRHLDGELARRGDAFRKVGAHDLAAHRASGGEHLPRVVLLIDEFQEFFTEDDAIARDAALLLDRFVRQGRAFGLHVVLGSQTLGGAYALAKSSLGQMGVRIALPCTETDAQLLLHEDNDGARLLTRPGDALYNDQAGMAAGNSPFQVCWLSATQEAELLAPLAGTAVAAGWKPTRPAVIFEGDAPSQLGEIGELQAQLAQPIAARHGGMRDSGVRAWVGEASSLQGAAEVVLPAAAGGNLLVVGQNRVAAAATCAAFAVGIAARHVVGELQLVALDGDDREGPFATVTEALAQQLPHGFARPLPRDFTQQLADLVAIIERRQSAAESERTPIVLFVFGLQRLRQLRPDEDAGFSSERSAGPDPAESFARILADGPECGVHAVVWCDSLAAVQRSLGRRRLRDFESRILFQMSAADSTELIDDDGASRLGLHSAIYSNQGDGLRMKFRPCSLPTPEVIAELGQLIRARLSGQTLT